MSGNQYNVVLVAGSNMDAEVSIFKRCAANFNRPGSHTRIVIVDKFPTPDELESWLIEEVDAVVLLLGDRWRNPLLDDVAQFDPELVFDAATGILDSGSQGAIGTALSAVAVFMKKATDLAATHEHGTARFRSAIGGSSHVHAKEFVSSAELDDAVFAWLSQNVPRRSKEDESKSSPLREAMELANSGLIAHAEGAFMLAVARADDVRAFIQYGKFLRKQGRLADACQQFERGVTRAQATNDNRNLVVALTENALARAAMGHHEHAAKLQEKAMKLAQETSDSRTKANSLSGSSRLKKSIGDYTAAMKQAKESLEICVLESDDAAIAAQHANIGLIYRRTGDLQLAEDWLTKALHLDQAAKREDCIARNLGNLALIYRARGDSDRARNALSQSIEINKRLSLSEGLANDYATLGQLYCDDGDYPEARRYHEASLALEEKMGRLEGIARSHTGLGMVCFGVFDNPGAVKHLKRAGQLFMQSGLQSEHARVFGMILAIEAGKHPVRDLAQFIKK